VCSSDLIEVSLDSEDLPAPYLFEGQPTYLDAGNYGETRLARADLKVVQGVDIEGVATLAAEGGQDEAPIPSATVRIRELVDPTSAETPFTAQTTTSDQGEFSFTRIAPRTYQLMVKHPDYVEGRLEEFDAASGKEARVTLHPFGSVSGHVVLANQDKAPSSATVTLMSEGEQEQMPVSPDESGAARFTFEDVEPGLYLLLGEAESGSGGHYYSETRLQLEPAEQYEAGALKLAPLGRIQGELVDPGEGETRRDITLSAEPLEEEEGSRFFKNFPPADSRRIPDFSVSPGGSFEIRNLIEGRRYLIKARANGQGSVLGTAQAEAGSSETVRLLLSGTGSVSGSVRNTRGEACAGTEVILSTRPGAYSAEKIRQQVRRQTIDYDGRYRFENLPSGPARIRLADEDGAARLISVPEDGNLEINFSCRDYVFVKFDVSDGSGQPIEAKEQFIVMPKPGTKAEVPLIELTYEELETRLEPGEYTIMRTATMESRSFRVNPRMDGTIQIDFGDGSES